MKNVLRVFLSSAFLAVCLSSCTNDDDNSNSNDILPLAIGNQWIFIDSTYYNNQWEIEYDTITITDKIKIGGVEGYTEIEDPTEFITTLNSDKDGNAVNIGGKYGSQEKLVQSVLFKNYPKAGEQWESYNPSWSKPNGLHIDTVLISCIGVDVPVKTKLGSFVCNVYTYSYYWDSDVDKFVYYLSRGIGIVKTEHCENNKFWDKQSLIKYSLKN